VKKLAMAILGHMAKALKMDGEEMVELFSDGFQSMRMNYYPPCPEPNKTIGLAPHSDADALTILYQLNETEGLQIRKDGRWVPVKPLPNAFVVNVGDIMEVLLHFDLNWFVWVCDFKKCNFLKAQLSRVRHCDFLDKKCNCKSNHIKLLV